MKKKVAFWVVMILVNAAVGVVSVRTYQKLEARISSVETSNKNYYEKFSRLESDNNDNKKINDNLLRILGVDGNYDFNGNLIKAKDLDKFFDYKTYIKTSVILEVPEGLRELNSNNEKIIIRKGDAPAVVIGKYVLAASHVSEAEIFSWQIVRFPTPSGAFEQVFEYKVLEHSVALVLADGSELLLREVYRNRDKDFSLFEMPKNVKSANFPFKIGKSDQLRVGHFIYINGRPAFRSEVARQGNVTSLTSVASKGELKVKNNDNEFSISQSTDGGDSGSPIMAFRDGEPELIGIYLGWVGILGDNGKNTRSRALKINVAIDEIKEKTKIDLRKLQHNFYEENKNK